MFFKFEKIRLFLEKKTFIYTNQFFEAKASRLGEIVYTKETGKSGNRTRSRLFKRVENIQKQKQIEVENVQENKMIIG